MFTYGYPYVVTFYLGLGIGVIGPAFDITIVIWLDTISTSTSFGLLLNIESRNRFDFTSIYKLSSG